MLHANTWTQRLLAKLSFTEITYSLMFLFTKMAFIWSKIYIKNKKKPSCEIFLNVIYPSLWCKTDFIIIIITEVFSISWSFRNNLNMLICCSRNSSNDQLWKQLWCLIYLWNVLQIYININTLPPGFSKQQFIFTVNVDQHQCWASYSNNVINYSLLLSKIILLLYLLFSGNSN